MLISQALLIRFLTSAVNFTQRSFRLCNFCQIFRVLDGCFRNVKVGPINLRNLFRKWLAHIRILEGFVLLVLPLKSDERRVQLIVCLLPTTCSDFSITFRSPVVTNQSQTGCISCFADGKNELCGILVQQAYSGSQKSCIWKQQKDIWEVL